MVMLEDHRGGRCSMADACSNPGTEEEVMEMLMKNVSAFKEIVQKIN